MGYTLHEVVSDLIKYGVPEDYFEPMVPISFGGKQYVADFRDLAILDVLRYPESAVDANAGVHLPLLNVLTRYVQIPVIHAGKQEIIKVKLKFAREVYMAYSKKCLEYVDVYNMLVEGLVDIFNNTELSAAEKDQQVDKLYSSSKFGTDIKRIKKM
jgi:hypothetical protein